MSVYEEKKTSIYARIIFYAHEVTFCKIEILTLFHRLHAVPCVFKSLFPISSVCLLVVHVLGSFCPSVFETFMFPELRFSLYLCRMLLLLGPL